MFTRHVLLVAIASALGCASGRAAPPPAPAVPASGSSAPSQAAPKQDSTPTPPGAGAVSTPNADPFPSTYRPVPSGSVAIRNATILTAVGPTIRNGTILLRDGKIVAVGANVTVPSDAQVVDGTGKFVTPGIIDTHSHLGVYAAPGVDALADGNEMSNPSTPQVWAEHSVWPQDPQFPRALSAGVTTIQVLPGSGNLIGGRSVVLKVVPSRTVQGMKFPSTKYGLKMACGENPKRVYAERGLMTRMGNVAGYRAQWITAEAYRRRWDKWLVDRKGDPPSRDLAMETLADVLRGNILVHNHCYRADEMAQMIDIAKEFGYTIKSFHHGVEAYKIADLLAANDISASVWSDWGGFKMEAMDGIRGNLPLLHNAGVKTIVHSDDANGMQRLNQDAAKGISEGNVAGIRISEDEAIKWITINPAWALGVDDRTGSLAAGKNADVVLWDRNPFSIYARAEKVWIDGAMLFDRLDPAQQWRTDFELGYVPAQKVWK